MGVTTDMDRIINSADLERVRKLVCDFHAQDNNKNTVFHLSLFLWCVVTLSTSLTLSLLGNSMSGWSLAFLTLFFFVILYGSTFFLIHSTRELLRVAATAATTGNTNGNANKSQIPRDDDYGDDDRITII